jgi:AraC-like DNA-binding protein
MTVPADSAKDRVRAATTGLVSLPVGSHLYQGEELTTGWHRHDVHEIEYAIRGTVEVETAAGHYLLPPHQAAWIPAGLRHRTTLNADVRTLAVIFAPELVPGAGDRVRIIGVSALLREMMLYSVGRPGSGSFFRALGEVVAGALAEEKPLNLPVSPDPIVAAATAHTRAHLADVTLGEVAREVGVSERTLRRLFATRLGMSWRSYLLRARMLRALTLLTDSGRTVLDVSIAVGFEDVGAFARSFARHCGETPSVYKRRVTAPPSRSGVAG